MSIVYNNIYINLVNLNYKLNTTLDEFLLDFDANNRNVSVDLNMTCDQGHNFSMKSNSFKNELLKFKKGTRKYLCSVCLKNVTTNVRKEYLEKHCDSLGFELISFEPKDRKVIYKCHCGNIANTNDSGLLRNSGNCNKCQNDKNKLSEKDAIETFEKAGLKLLDFSEYKNNKSKLSYICSCGEKASACFHDIDQHYKNNGAVGCMKCRNKRIANKLTDGKYDNVFQIPETKEKIKITCLNKYGFDHHMKNEEIKKKLKILIYKDMV